MDLYEFQGKNFLNQAGIKTPRGALVEDIGDVEETVERIGQPCVIKAQLLRGSRGKSGLIEFAHNSDQALKKARQMWEKNTQVEKLLIEEKIDSHSELYVSVMPDSANAGVNFLLSTEGGVDIEEVATQNPERIVSEQVSLFTGVMPFNVRNLVMPLKLEKETGKNLGKVINGLYSVFRNNDATLVEINPLIITGEGEVVAADAKVSVDNNALYRQPFEQQLKGFSNEIEYEAAKEGIPYLQFDGDIGLMCAGAGLTNTVYDLIHYQGGKPANFLEFGGPNYHKAFQAMQLTLKTNPAVILIVTFGTIARADVIAQGVANAVNQLAPGMPIVTAIRGTNEKQAAEILQSVGLMPLQETEEAVRKAVELARE